MDVQSVAACSARRDAMLPPSRVASVPVHGLSRHAFQPLRALEGRSSSGLVRGAPSYAVWNRNKNAGGRQNLVRHVASEERVVTENAVELTPLAEEEGDAYDWARQWWPVAVVGDLEPRRPHAITLLGKSLVVWRDASGQWRTFRDRCPHRLAALSEGRIEPVSGSLQCSYHGYTFDGKGDCVRIPQAASAEAEARSCADPRACVESYPTQVQRGIVWVWGDAGADAVAESSASSPLLDLLPGEEEAEADGTKYHTTEILRPFMREMPYDYETLLENAADPSHVPWSHHGVQGNRDKVTYGNNAMKAVPGQHKLQQKVELQMSSGRKQTLTFDPPCRLQYSVPLPPNKPGEPEARFLFTIWAVPTEPGKSRIIATQRANSRMRAFRLMSLVPAWVDHVLNRNAVLDGDAVFLHQQEKVLAQEWKESSATWKRLYYLASSADTMLARIRQWLDGPKAGGGPWGMDRYLKFPPLITDRAQLLDRFHSHTKHCASCSKAFAWVSALRIASAILAATAAVATAVLPVALPAGKGPLAAAGSAVLSAAAALACVLLGRLRQKFLFEDYEHWVR